MGCRRLQEKAPPSGSEGAELSEGKEPGEAIEYESVFYRTLPYSVRAYAEENG